MHSVWLQRLLWICCPGHAPVRGNEQADRLASTADITDSENEQADRLASTADITSGLQLGRAEVLKGLRSLISAWLPGRQTADSSGRKYRSGPSLCTHAWPDSQVLDSWISATNTLPGCPMPEVHMYLPIRWLHSHIGKTLTISMNRRRSGWCSEKKEKGPSFLFREEREGSVLSVQRRERSFTIASLRRELSSTRTVKCQGAIVCKSRATHRELITCNMLCATRYEETVHC